MVTTTERIQLNRKTAAQWTAANPVLLAGEAGVELDTGRAKFGNGTTAWTALPYSGGGATGGGGTTVTTVAGRSGDVTLTPADVQLGSVQNLAPAALPVSTATAAALAGKADYPAGGVNGQALVKSGTGTAWATVTGSGGGSSSPRIVDVPAPTGTAADTAAISTAISGLTSGSLLRFQPGTYTVSIRRFTIQNLTDVIIDGQGATISNSYTGGAFASDCQTLYVYRSSRVQVRDLTVIGNAGTALVDNIGIDHCQDVLVTGCTVSHAGTGRGTGIRLWGCTRATVSGNTVLKTTADGIAMYSHGRNSAGDSSMTAGSAVLTSGSMGFSATYDIGAQVRVTGAGAAGATLTGTVLSVSGSSATLSVTASTTVSSAVTNLSHENWLISVVGNRVDSPGDDSISFVAYTGGEVNHRDITVVGNVLYRGSARGVVLQGVTGGVVADNIIDSTSGSAIIAARDNGSSTLGVQDIVISGNRITNANVIGNSIGAYPSIWAYSIGTYPCDNILITGNIIRGGGVQYIQAGQAGGATGSTSNVLITGNQCIGGNAALSGIKAQLVKHLTIDGNMVQRSNTSAISVQPDVTGIVEITGNTIVDPNTSVTAGSTGISATGLTTAGTVLRVGNNTIVTAAGDVTTKGYDLSTSTNVLVHGNRSTAPAGVTGPASTATYSLTS